MRRETWAWALTKWVWWSVKLHPLWCFRRQYDIPHVHHWRIGRGKWVEWRDDGLPWDG